jgi:CRISPR/Cas system-associated protein Csm6
MNPPVRLPPETINPVDALRLSSAALDLAEGDAQKAVALLVHGLAGTLVMAIRPQGIARLIEDRGGEFGATLAEALPAMADLLDAIEAKALASMRTAGQA